MAAKKESKKARKKRLAQEEKSGMKANASSSASSTKKSKVKAKKPKTDWKKLWPLAAILIFSFVCFSPSLDCGFVNWDDDKNFYENEHITTLNKDNFWVNTKKIFSTGVIGNYNPLPIWSFLIEQKIYSDKKQTGLQKPHLFHLDNILLHLICVFFIFLIGREMGLGMYGNIFFTLLFAIHPLRVESVTWITERKDVLYGAFFLPAVYYYIKGVKYGSNFKYLAIIWVCFILSLLSKIQAVTLPIVMILIDYYFSGKITFKGILKKTPYFAASLITGIVGIMMLRSQGSLEMVDEYTGITRLFIGSWSLIIYLVKSIVPYELSPLYPYPTSIPWYYYLSIVSFIATAAYLWYAYKKDWRVGFFGVGFFISNIIFLLQILGAGQGFLADRFSYISFIGLYFIYAFYAEKLLSHKPKLQYGIYGLTAVILLAYGFTTYNQTKIWKDSETLWTHVLKYYGNITLPYGNRANFRRDKSQDLKKLAQQAKNSNNQAQYQQLNAEANKYVQLALADYTSTIKLKPNEAGPYNSRARLYFNFENRDSLLKALENYNKAIEIKPKENEYWINRGATYAKLGDMDNALKNLNEGIKLNPGFGNGYLNRSVIFNQRGDYNNALKDLNSYLKIKPYNADIWYECARINNTIGKSQEALNAINNALRYGRTNKGFYLYEKARTHFLMNDFTQAKQAIAQMQQTGYQPADKTLMQQILSK